MTHDVTFTRKEYDDAVGAWTLVDDVCAGQRRIKSKTTEYLPQPNPSDTGPDNTERFKQYIARAIFLNAAGRTKTGMVGAVFDKEPVMQVPPALDYVEDDVDGAGVSINQQARGCLSHILQSGRAGLLTDYPKTEGATSMADQTSGKIRANILVIPAVNVVNWRVEKVGAVYKLTMLVFRESVTEPSGFGVDSITQYRVLKLEGGIYTQEIYRKAKEDWVLFEGPIIMRNGAGGPWGEIPFTFVGANNNDSVVDPAPLYDMAEINIGHYHNSADYEDSVYFCGQVQPWMSGLSEEWRDWMQENGLFIGSRAPILLPAGGSFGMAQAQPNTMAKEAMDQKEAQMIGIGARLMQPGTVAKTATQDLGEQSVQHSVLSLAASNVSAAYTKALGWAAAFMNVSGDIEYQLNQDLSNQEMSAQDLTAWVGALQSGNLPKTDFWQRLRAAEYIDPNKTDEEIREELDSDDSGIDLDDVIPVQPVIQQTDDIDGDITTTD